MTGDPASNELSPFNIIFSCVICQRTIGDVYPGATGSSQSESENAIPTCKLWLTECTHLTCSEHLPGGGRFEMSFLVTILT
jgi:hypothetical protein